MKMSDIAPDLRIPWLALPNGVTERRFRSGSVSLLAPLCTDAETSLVSVEPAAGRTMNECLEAAVGELTEDVITSGPLSVTLRLALVLGIWDEEFRAAGLFPGNIYLASERAVPRILEVADIIPTEDPTYPLSLNTVLTELFRAELIYRFPVAIKFRGEFGAERQFRLNCWGRRLGIRLQAQTAIGCLATSARRRIRTHLDRYDSAYREHMTILADIAAHPVGAAWTSAEQLPVGVLL
jgi:hypothetical protein